MFVWVLVQQHLRALRAACSPPEHAEGARGMLSLRHPGCLSSKLLIPDEECYVCDFVITDVSKYMHADPALAFRRP